MKPGAVLFFIDNYQGNVFESIKDVLNQTGLEIVLGPLHEVYVKPAKQHNEATYGCLAQTAARISIVGLMKSMKIIPQIFYSPSSWNKQEDFIGTSFSLDEDDCNDENAESNLNKCHKSVQTAIEDSDNVIEDYIQKESLQCDIEELPALMEALTNLLEVVKNLKMNNRQSEHLCYHCHSKQCF